MSRQPPPLPPGLPPRPVDRAGPDSYRPNSDSHSSRDRPHMYQFSGNSARPIYDRRSPPRNDYAPGVDRSRYDSYRSHDNGYAPGTGPGPRQNFGLTRPYPGPEPDVYRPNDGRYGQEKVSSHPRLRSADDVYRTQESNFTFRHEAPPSIDFTSADIRRPRSPLRQRDRGYLNSNSYRGNNNSRHHGGQGGQRGGYQYRGRGGPRLASERDFLKGNRAPTPELMAGMEEDDAHGVRYKPIGDVSDSSEAEMDMSDEDGEVDDSQPRKKQARTDNKAADGNSAPKWSNPDPYTVLPPPDETQRKKKDVVKLIRKARVEATTASTANTQADADDFISFDFEDDAENYGKEDGILSKPHGIGVVGAPTGPRQPDHRVGLQMEGRGTALTSGIDRVVDLTTDSPTGSKKRNAIDGVQKSTISNSANTIDLTADSPLGSRKRTIRDEIKETPTLREAIYHGPVVMNAPEIHKTLKGKPPPVRGDILRAWAPKSGLPQTPWVDIDHSDTANMGLW